MLTVMRRIEQRDLRFICYSLKQSAIRRIVRQLGLIACCKLIPDSDARFVKPFTKRSRRSYRLVPPVIMKIFMRKPARPQSVYIDAVAVSGRSGVIGPLYFNCMLHSNKYSVMTCPQAADRMIVPASFQHPARSGCSLFILGFCWRLRINSVILR